MLFLSIAQKSLSQMSAPGDTGLALEELKSGKGQ